MGYREYIVRALSVITISIISIVVVIKPYIFKILLELFQSITGIKLGTRSAIFHIIIIFGYFHPVIFDIQFVYNGTGIELID